MKRVIINILQTKLNSDLNIMIVSSNREGKFLTQVSAGILEALNKTEEEHCNISITICEVSGRNDSEILQLSSLV